MAQSQFIKSVPDGETADPCVDKMAVHVQIKDDSACRKSVTGRLSHMEEKAMHYLMLFAIFLLGAVSWQLFLLFLRNTHPATVVLSGGNAPQQIILSSADASAKLTSLSRSLDDMDSVAQALSDIDADRVAPRQGSYLRKVIHIVHLRLPFTTTSSIIRILTSLGLSPGNMKGRKVAVRVSGWAFNLDGVRRLVATAGRTLGFAPSITKVVEGQGKPVAIQGLDQLMMPDLFQEGDDEDTVSEDIDGTKAIPDVRLASSSKTAAG